jgi:hypothetical protein
MDDHLIRMMQLAQKGYTCSQIIIQLGLEAMGQSNPALVRAMAGFAYGFGNGAGICGALAGGCALIALHGAKGQDDESESDRLPLMLNELADWFETSVSAKYGGITCRTILEELSPSMGHRRCGDLVAETYAKAMDILVANDFDSIYA